MGGHLWESISPIAEFEKSQVQINRFLLNNSLNGLGQNSFKEGFPISIESKKFFHLLPLKKNKGKFR